MKMSKRWQISIICKLGFLVIFGTAYKINITSLSNCQATNMEYPVAIVNVTQVQNNGLYDTVNGYYIVRNTEDMDRYVDVKLYKCNKKNIKCQENLNERTYIFACEHRLDKIGPWTIFLDAMVESHCTHLTGVFPFNNLFYNHEYFDGYLDISPEFKFYRLQLVFRLEKGETSFNGNGSYPVRACIDTEFSVNFE